MKVRITPFVEFAYGDRRKDKASVSQILSDMKKDYDPVTDRYKQFREALGSFESGAASEADFRSLYKSVTPNKRSGYQLLAENYLALKEDHALIWQGPHKVSAMLGELEIYTSWYLRTDASNMRRVIFLNFRKDPFPRKQERGLLTLMQVAEQQSAGVGILNIQSSTLVLGTRLDQKEKEFLEGRAGRFVEISGSL